MYLRKLVEMSNPSTVTILNPITCGIYKNGKSRFKIDPKTGERTTEVDNELLEHIDAYLAGAYPSGGRQVSLDEIFDKRVLVPTYFDDRHNRGIDQFLEVNNVDGITIGELIESGVIAERRGHGSPPNDQRSGHIPYVKVSDIRGLRINVNPTNLVSEPVATRYWKGTISGLEAWDLITPNRASSNIGEFAILLPGEEEIVITKEVFVFRSTNERIYDAFYLLWAFSLRSVRDQWRRIALMQTNREDCGNRYKEIVLPKPPDESWAKQQSEPFRVYFNSIAEARAAFTESLEDERTLYTANVIPVAKHRGLEGCDENNHEAH